MYAIRSYYAVGSAALTSLALFSAFTSTAHIDVISITNPYVMIGLFIGGVLPFIFSSFTMRAVGNAAFHIIEEVRRQFKEIPGLMKGTAKPDYKSCVTLATQAALVNMIFPAALAIVSPVIVGILLGVEALGGRDNFV